MQGYTPTHTFTARTQTITNTPLHEELHCWQLDDSAVHRACNRGGVSTGSQCSRSKCRLHAQG